MELVAFRMDINAKMSDLHCSIAFRLGISMLKHSICICVSSDSRGVISTFGHFFVNAFLYTNIKVSHISIIVHNLS